MVSEGSTAHFLWFTAQSLSPHAYHQVSILT
jgi:hypothetical protein